MKSRCRPLVALASGLAFFAGLQVAFAVLMEWFHPVLRDPELGYKTTLLRQHTAMDAGRPLVVVLGSSRSALGFRPDVLEGRRWRYSDPPLVFNHAVNGAGPLMQLICLHRLLREGIRPQLLIVEAHPALLCQEGCHQEGRRIDPQRLGWHELEVLRRHSPDGGMHLRRWCRSRLTPAWSHRFWILSHYAPAWLPNAERPFDSWRALDRFGWKPHERQFATTAERQRALDAARQEYSDRLQEFRISEEVDRVWRELLAVCRDEGIRPVLVTMPESTEFRSWYPPESAAEVGAYLSGLSREYRAPWVDARAWAADQDFHDGHHLLASGAVVFTTRFGDVLDYLFADRN